MYVYFSEDCLDDPKERKVLFYNWRILLLVPNVKNNHVKTKTQLFSYPISQSRCQVQSKQANLIITLKIYDFIKLLVTPGGNTTDRKETIKYIKSK